MPRAFGDKSYLGAIRGLITEANPLAFPEGATLDEKNFLLQKDGQVRARRRGFENFLPSSYVISHALSTAVEVTSVYYWDNPEVHCVFLKETGSVNRTFARLHRNDALFSFLQEYEVNATEGADVQVAESSEYLVLSTGGNKPVLLQYISSTPEITAQSIDLYVRDFELVPDGLQISGRPATLQDTHKYNLLNAGWWAPRYLESSGNLGDPLEEFKSNQSSRTLSTEFVAPSTLQGIQDISLSTLQVGATFEVSGTTSNDGTYTVASVQVVPGSPQSVTITVLETTVVDESTVETTYEIDGAYPSNADIPLLGTKANSDGAVRFSAETLDETVTGNTEAPRGHYVFAISAFDRNSRLSSPGTDGTASTTLGPSTSIPL